MHDTPKHSSFKGKDYSSEKSPQARKPDLAPQPLISEESPLIKRGAYLPKFSHPRPDDLHTVHFQTQKQSEDHSGIAENLLRERIVDCIE
jgi:hypothetical protein